MLFPIRRVDKPWGYELISTPELHDVVRLEDRYGRA